MFCIYLDRVAVRVDAYHSGYGLRGDTGVRSRASPGIDTQYRPAYSRAVADRTEPQRVVQPDRVKEFVGSLPDPGGVRRALIAASCATVVYSGSSIPSR